MPIEIRNLKYVYDKGGPFEKVALKDINLKINDGEFVAVIGHTGSGKSTLIQLFNGLLKPTEGTVLVNGKDTRQSNLKELRKQVGIVFQYPEHQLFEETVYRDIDFGLQKNGITGKEAEERILEAIRNVGLSEDILDKSPFELSGGQKRRVAIAGVIVMKPGILVLDEPTAGLDPAGKEEILGHIARLHEKYNITVVLVSHSMEDVASLARRVVVMNNGTIEMDGTPEEVFRHVERIEKIGLSAPQITYLMKKLHSRFPWINDNVLTVEQACAELLRHIGGH